MSTFVSNPSRPSAVTPMHCLARNTLANNIIVIEGLVAELASEPDARDSHTIPAKLTRIQSALGDLKSKVIDTSPILLTETSEERRARIMASVIERVEESEAANVHRSLNWSLAVSTISIASIANAVSYASVNTVASSIFDNIKQDATRTTTPAVLPTGPSLEEQQYTSARTNVLDEVVHGIIDSLVEPRLPGSILPPTLAFIIEESHESVHVVVPEPSFVGDDPAPLDTRSFSVACINGVADISWHDEGGDGDNEGEYNKELYIESQWSGLGIDNKLLISLGAESTEDEMDATVTPFLHVSQSEPAISPQPREELAAMSVSISTLFLHVSSSATRAPRSDVSPTWAQEVASFEDRAKHGHIVKCTPTNSVHGKVHLTNEEAPRPLHVNRAPAITSKECFAAMSSAASASWASPISPSACGGLPASLSDPTGLSLRISAALALFPNAIPRSEASTKALPDDGRIPNIFSATRLPGHPQSSVHGSICFPEIIESTYDKPKVEYPLHGTTPFQSATVAASKSITITPSPLRFSFTPSPSPSYTPIATPSTTPTPSSISSTALPVTPSPDLKRPITPLAFTKPLKVDASPRSPSSFFKLKSNSVRLFFNPPSATKSDVSYTKSDRVSSLRSLFTPSEVKDTASSLTNAPRWPVDLGRSPPSSGSPPELRFERSRSRLVPSRNKLSLSSKFPFLKRSVRS